VAGDRAGASELMAMNGNGHFRELAMLVYRGALMGLIGLVLYLAKEVRDDVHAMKEGYLVLKGEVALLREHDRAQDRDIGMLWSRLLPIGRGGAP
jgi:hypothetical protein